MIDAQIRIGVISDTHGQLPPGVPHAFERVDRIIHAGDIDHPLVLDALREIAPVTAVRGNMDGGSWARRLPRGDMLQVGGVTLYVQHIVERLEIDPIAAGVRVIISGHSHQPLNEWRDGILFFNPGSAAFPRYGSLPSVGELTIDGGNVSARIISI